MSANDIAIIGMAGRFPGARNLDEYWRNLRDGVDSIRRLGDDELKNAGVSAADLQDPSYVRACPVLEGVDQFDASFFGFNPRDAAVMDPAHRLFLEVAWESMESASRTGSAEEGPIGVFAGSGAPYYLMDHVRPNSALMRSMGEFLARHTNNDMNFLATRVSYEMDLRGPSVNVQTACSSALVAVHMACESIRRGECRMALAGGATVLIPDRQGYLYQEGEIMSPDGRCRPFDKASAGTVFGSGTGCVVLKRLSEALDDGDCILAVIKGSAINNDGARRAGYLAPGVDGQSAVVSLALDAAGVPAECISYIEAHGTGTSVGDPIEIAALNQAFKSRTDRRGFCAVASVKSNIGHLGEAAGIASLIKAVLAIKHRQLPPSLGFEAPNPQIDFDDSPFFVNERLRPWSSENPLRCGVTALGAGGTNCHVILEEPPAPLPAEGARDTHLIVLSARTAEALERARENLAAAIDEEGAINLGDASWSLAVGRRPMPHRCAVVGRDRSTIVSALRADSGSKTLTSVADEAARSVVFMFPGGGAQFSRMGVELYEKEPAYRKAVAECLAVINPRLGQPLESLLFAGVENASSASRELERPSLTLPALFTTSYALATLFRTWGIEASAYVGHSMGEYVAACLSGVMTLDQALCLVMLRGRLFEATPKGGMLSVALSEPALRAVLPDGLSIAVVNAPEMCVASGPVELIESFQRTLAEQEIDCTRIRIDVAAHSSMLDPILKEFSNFCRTIDFRPPKIPFVSNVSGRWITPAEAVDPDYWVRHLRSTVRFADCLGTIAQDVPDCVLLEVGPGRTLSTLAGAQSTPARFAYSSMGRAEENANDLANALVVVGRLWLAGVPIDWTAFFDGQLLSRIPLPTYSWDHKRFWIEPPVPAALPTAIAYQPDTRRSLEDWFARPTWRQALPPEPLKTESARVLFFVDQTGLSDAVVARLVAAGRRVLTVSPGTAWMQRGDTFVVRPGAFEDYQLLMRAVATDGGLPPVVVHAWSVTGNAGDVALDEILERGFHSLHCFAQALSSEDVDTPSVLTVLTSNLQRIGGESSIDPGKALVLGPARVMPNEFPHIRSRSVDVSLPPATAQLQALGALIAAEVVSEPSETTVAYRGQDRFELELACLQLPNLTSRLRRGGVYLITGGFGGLGYTLAKHLAARHAAKLILVGRNTRGIRASTCVAALKALGSEVDVVQADVTDAVAMRSAVEQARQRFGSLNGIFHAAGVLGDSLMSLKSRQDALEVIAPKVQGTLALAAAVEGVPLDVFVLFSSISSRAGLPGQADYTAANAFLDAFAQSRNASDGTFTVAVNWSAWRDAGMAANIVAGSSAVGSGADAELHPILGRRLWAGTYAELYGANLSAESSWVLGEHRLRGGRCLMPGTGYVELVRAAFAACMGAGPVEIRDLTFVSAFVVPDKVGRDLRVHVARNSQGESKVAIAGRAILADGSDVWQEHVTATVVQHERVPEPALDIVALRARCGAREELFGPMQQSVHMDFGRRWKNLVSIRYGKAEAVVQLELQPEFAPDLGIYELHPALLDMATGRCEALFEGFDPTSDFYVPLSYTRLRMFAPLTARLFSHVRLAPSDFDPKELLVFNVTITDEDGRVLVQVDDFVMARVTDVAGLQNPVPRLGAHKEEAIFNPPAAPGHLPPMVRLLEGAIGLDEGMEVIERILAGPNVAQLYVTPVPADELIRQLRSPPAVREPERSESAAEATVAVADTEATLSTHEAVQSCAVLQRRNRPGDLKLVAYVVFKSGEQATVSDLRRFLRTRLSDELVPSTFVDLDALPMGGDGKVNRGALPDPFGAVDDTLAPRTSSEMLVAGVWKDLLGLERISVHDNFFDCGGHSLLAVRAIAKIAKTTGIRISQSTMVLKTLEQVAAELDRQASASPQAEVAPVSSAPIPAPASGLGARVLAALRRQ